MTSMPLVRCSGSGADSGKSYNPQMYMKAPRGAAAWGRCSFFGQKPAFAGCKNSPFGERCPQAFQVALHQGEVGGAAIHFRLGDVMAGMEEGSPGSGGFSNTVRHQVIGKLNIPFRPYRL